MTKTKQKKDEREELITVTRAKQEYNLKEHQFESLKVIKMKNPHGSSYPMRLYKLSDVIEIASNTRIQDAQRVEEGRINLEKERIEKIESSCKITIDQIQG